MVNLLLLVKTSQNEILVTSILLNKSLQFGLFILAKTVYENSVATSIDTWVMASQGLCIFKQLVTCIVLMWLSFSFQGEYLLENMCCVPALIRRFGLWLSVIPASGNFTPSSDFLRHCTHMVHGQSCRKNTYTLKLKIKWEKKLFKKRKVKRSCNRGWTCYIVSSQVLQPILNFFKFYLYSCFAHMFIHSSCTRSMLKIQKKMYWILWNWSYGWFWVIIWMLRSYGWSTEMAASAFNWWARPLDQQLSF